MAFQKRAPSMDMASIELRASPAPTYASACRGEDWPLPPQPTSLSLSSRAQESISNNPFYPSTVADPGPLPVRSNASNLKTKMDGEDLRVKADHHDCNHPHYAEPSTKPYTIPSPPLPPRSRWPRKRVLVPWALAMVFFSTTLWFVSIAFGARFVSILHPLPSAPASQEINIFIDGAALQSAILKLTAVPNTSASVSSTIVATSVASSDAILSATGRLHLAPTGQPSLDDIDGRLERRFSGFVTVTKRMG